MQLAPEVVGYRALGGLVQAFESALAGHSAIGSLLVSECRMGFMNLMSSWGSWGLVAWWEEPGILTTLVLGMPVLILLAELAAGGLAEVPGIRRLMTLAHVIFS